MAGPAQDEPAACGTRTDDVRDDATGLMAIIRMLPDAVFRCERRDDGRILFSLHEGRLAEELGVTTDRVRGVPLDQWFGGAAAEWVVHFDRAFGGDETAFLSEIGGRRFSHHPKPVRDAAGHIVALVGYVTEVTEADRNQEQVDRLAEELAQARTEASEATRQLEAFTYTLSHDLRTPLSVIATQCDVLQRTLPADVPERTMAGIARMQNGVRRMNGLITDTLDLSRAARAPLEVDEVDLNDVAMDVVAELRERDPGRRVIVEVAPELHGRGDARLLRQVLRNLIGNAWKFTGSTPDARIRVYAEDHHSGRTYVVSDNGIGFAAHEASAVFEPFQRLHAAQEFEGNGIGLTTVHKIVYRHGGRVWAEAEPGRGATFRFTLGTEAARRSAAPQAAAAMPTAA